MSVPIFMKQNEALFAIAPSGNLFASGSTLIPHPTQKAGAIPLLGNSWRNVGPGDPVSRAVDFLKNNHNDLGSG